MRRPLDLLQNWVIWAVLPGLLFFDFPWGMFFATAVGVFLFSALTRGFSTYTASEENSASQRANYIIDYHQEEASPYIFLYDSDSWVFSFCSFLYRFIDNIPTTTLCFACALHVLSKALYKADPMVRILLVKRSITSLV